MKDTRVKRIPDCPHHQCPLIMERLVHDVSCMIRSPLCHLDSLCKTGRALRIWLAMSTTHSFPRRESTDKMQIAPDNEFDIEYTSTSCLQDGAEACRVPSRFKDTYIKRPMWKEHQERAAENAIVQATWSVAGALVRLWGTIVSNDGMLISIPLGQPSNPPCCPNIHLLGVIRQINLLRPVCEGSRLASEVRKYPIRILTSPI
jgi:hypothetical protein